MKMGTPTPPNFRPMSIVANGWMDQDGTWHGGRPQPRRLCVRRDPASLPKKGAEPPSPIFGPFLLWPNGWMHQDVTWPQPEGLCGRWGPSPSPRRGRRPPIFGPCLLWPNGGMGMDQDATWYGGRPRPRRHRFRWGTSLPSPRRERSLLPNFRPMFIVAKRLDGSRWYLAWRWALVQATLC